MLNKNSRKILVIIGTIIILALIGSVISYTIGRFIIKYDPDIEHKRIFSSDSFNILFPTLLFYALFIYVIYYAIFEKFFNNKVFILVEGIFTAIIAITLIEVIGNHFTIAVVGITIGKIVFYTSIFSMSVLLPLFHQFIKKRIMR